MSCVSKLLSITATFTSLIINTNIFLTRHVHSQGRSRLRLTQSDFDDGTIRITEGNVLITFEEDIVFNPNSDWDESPNEEGAYFPQDSNLYPGSDGTAGSFRLGFFAGLSLEADNIEVDLEGHTFSVHPEFQIQQRFFTLIGM